MPEKSDWLKLNEEKRKVKAPVEDSRTVRMAQLLAGKLTSNGEWSGFQEYASSNIARLEMIVESFKLTLISHEVVNNEELVRAKIGLHAHQAALEVYRDMLNYPVRLKIVEKDTQ